MANYSSSHQRERGHTSHTQSTLQEQHHKRERAVLEQYHLPHARAVAPEWVDEDGCASADSYRHHPRTYSQEQHVNTGLNVHMNTQLRQWPTVFTMLPIDDRKMRERHSTAPPRRWQRLVLFAAPLALLVPALFYLRKTPASRSESKSHAWTANTAAGLVMLAQHNTGLFNDLLAANTTAAEVEDVDDEVAAIASSPSAAASHAAPAANHANGLAQRGGSGATTKPWLRIALISVGRSSGAEYLLHTLRGLLHGRPTRASHPLRAAAELVVVNNHEPAEAHEELQRARSLFDGRVRFLTKSHSTPPPACRQHEGRRVSPLYIYIYIYI